MTEPPQPGPPPFRPAWWARGSHAQTLAGHFLESRSPEPPWERFTLPLSDGEALRVKFLPGTSDTVLFLFHGLGGSADASYVRRAAALFHAQGHAVYAPNHRGAGEGRGLARKPYHSGSTGDLAAVLQHGRERFPHHRHIAVGYSISGNMLLLLLGRDAARLALPDAAIAVNPPVDLDRCSQRLRHGFNQVYDWRFVKLLMEDTARRLERQEFLALGRPKTLRDFDEAYTAPRAGFRSRAEYYRQCSCGPHLASISVPTVILSSLDDPFAPAGDIQVQDRSECVHLHVETHGGHMGYIAAGGERWLESALEYHLEALRAGLHLSRSRIAEEL